MLLHCAVFRSIGYCDFFTFAVFWLLRTWFQRAIILSFFTTLKSLILSGFQQTLSLVCALAHRRERLDINLSVSPRLSHDLSSVDFSQVVFLPAV